MIPPTDPLSFKIPGRLDEGDEAKFFFTEAEFKGGLSETLEVLRRSRWPKLAVRRFKVGVYTNTGEDQLVPIDVTVRKVLLEQLESAKEPTSHPEPVAPPAAEIPARVTEFWPIQFRSSEERLAAVASLQASVKSPSGLQRMTSARRPVIWTSGETLFLSEGALDIARNVGLDTMQSTPISVADLPPERSLLIGDAIDCD